MAKPWEEYQNASSAPWEEYAQGNTSNESAAETARLASKPVPAEPKSKLRQAFDLMN
jgi:hypothetical protein